MVLSNSVVAFQGFLSSTKVAPGVAVEVCLFVAVNLAQAETGKVQFTPITGAYFPFGLGMVTGLGLAADQCTPPALGQLPFVLAALAQRVYAATGEVLAVESWLLVEGIHFVSDYGYGYPLLLYDGVQLLLSEMQYVYQLQVFWQQQYVPLLPTGLFQLLYGG